MTNANTTRMRNEPIMAWSCPPEADAPRIPEILVRVLRLAGEPEPFIRDTALDLLAEARVEAERHLHGDYTEDDVAHIACAMVF